jgi:hypothetical protein
VKIRSCAWNLLDLPARRLNKEACARPGSARDTASGCATRLRERETIAVGLSGPVRIVNFAGVVA